MKPNLTLVGHVCRDYHEARSFTNQEKTLRIEDYVRQFFWCGSMYLHNKDHLSQEGYTYPECFAAGWFMQELNGEIKQSIVVACGSTLQDARQKMLALGQKLDWN